MLNGLNREVSTVNWHSRSEMLTKKYICWWIRFSATAHLQKTHIIACSENVLDSQSSAYYLFSSIWTKRMTLCKEWCTCKWTLDQRRKKRGGGCITPRLRFHYVILFIPSMTRKLHFLDKIRRIFLVKWTRLGNIIRQIIVAMLLHCIYTYCIYRRT